jgi:hypothetical protein
MWSQIMLHTILFNPWHIDINIVKLEVEAVIVLGGHHRIGIDDLFDVDVEEVIERVDVLLHEPAQSQERRHQLPLLLDLLQRLRGSVRVVKLVELVTITRVSRLSGLGPSLLKLKG